MLKHTSTLRTQIRLTSKLTMQQGQFQNLSDLIKDLTDIYNDFGDGEVALKTITHKEDKPETVVVLYRKGRYVPFYLEKDENK